MNKKLILGSVLFTLGLLGVLSLLTVTLPLDSLPPEVLEQIPPQTLKYIILINPTILLLVAVVIGTLLYHKVGLSVPTLSALLKIETSHTKFVDQAKIGSVLGLLTGLLISLVALLFKSYVPQEFTDLNNKIQLSPLARFLYGGITEELLLRYGFMTLVVWIVFKISKKLNGITYWTGIVLSSIIFAIGHFPAVYGALEYPSFTLLLYVLIGNSIAGLFFGWLYWKKGLEAAFIAHLFAHVMLIAVEQMN